MSRRYDLGYRGTTAETKALMAAHRPKIVYTWTVTNGAQRTVLANVYDPQSRIVDQREYPADEADLAAEWAARRALTLRSRGGTP